VTALERILPIDGLGREGRRPAAVAS
jgi:hypothetical protein